MKINWRPIQGYEGLYEVSDTGIIRSLTRRVWNKGNGSYSLILGKVMTLDVKGKDYAQVRLSRDSNSSSKLVHRIVAIAFIDNPNNLPEVNHKDCNKQNNRADNLEWMDRDANAAHAKQAGRYSNMPRGTQKKTSKLSDDAVRHIRLRVLKNSEYCNLYHVAPSTITMIQVDKNRWKHVA